MVRRLLALQAVLVALVLAVPAHAAQSLAAQSLAPPRPAADIAGQRPAEIVPLWSGPPPGRVTVTGPEEVKQIDIPGVGSVGVLVNVTAPTLTVVRPAPGKANGTAMLVLPGGGFAALAWDHEGLEIARWLADRGVTAFVVKYRVGKVELPAGPPPKTAADFLRQVLEPGRQVALTDVSQAMRLVRGRASAYAIDPHRVGVIGFSAGAITTMGVLLEAEPADRPDFAVPVYGMIAAERPVADNAPPLFIVAAQDDATVPVEGSTHIFELWSKAKRPAELHVYEKGGHGFGARAKGPAEGWMPALEAWLASHGLLSAPPARAAP